MDRRFLTVLAVSLVFALVVATVFYQVARAGRSRSTARAVQEDVVMAVRALSVGMTVKASDVRLDHVPASTFPHGGFERIDEVVNRPVISTILADEPVVAGRLAMHGTGLGLAQSIPVGMRAMTVRVNDVVGVAGFVFPGMHVDVLVTGRPPGADGLVTTTCLEDILVLSSGTTTEPDERGRPMPAPTVTLLVSPDDAVTLTLASSDGRIQLVLRNSSDQRVQKTAGREISELYGVSAAKRQPEPAGALPARVRARPAARAPAVIPAAPDEVIVIRGTKRSVEILSEPSRPQER